MQVEPGWRGFVSGVDQVEVQLPGTAWSMVLRNPQEFLVAAVVRGDD